MRITTNSPPSTQTSPNSSLSSNFSPPLSQSSPYNATNTTTSMTIKTEQDFDYYPHNIASVDRKHYLAINNNNTNFGISSDDRKSINFSTYSTNNTAIHSEDILSSSSRIRSSAPIYMVFNESRSKGYRTRYDKINLL